MRSSQPVAAVPFGKYLLLRRIAVGGMAELFLAREVATGRPLVIKRILPHLSKEAEFVQMFLDEARIAAQLHHPNIVQVHELGSLQGSIFIAMEYVNGVDVRHILRTEQRKSGAVPLPVAAYLTAAVCAGLQYAHTCEGLDGRLLGVIHRDVSPQNVMVGYDGQVKLVDFGIAKATSQIERSKPGVIKGKFLYLSPEQLSQERIDQRADLFAVGTMLYELTVGRSPFHKPTSEAVIYAIRTEEPPPPHLGKTSYSRVLSSIVMRCLTKDRNRRYQTAEEVRRELQHYLEDEAPQYLEPGPVREYLAQLFPREVRLDDTDEDDDSALGAESDSQITTSPEKRRAKARAAKLPAGRKPTQPELPVADQDDATELARPLRSSGSEPVAPPPARKPGTGGYVAAGAGGDDDTRTETESKELPDRLPAPVPLPSLLPFGDEGIEPTPLPLPRPRTMEAPRARAAPARPATSFVSPPSPRRRPWMPLLAGIAAAVLVVGGFVCWASMGGSNNANEDEAAAEP